MIDFSQLSRLNFSDESAFAALDSMLGEVASFAETRTAAEISSILAKKIEADQSLRPRLEPFVAKFRVLALPVLTDQQAVTIFSSIAGVVGDERIGLYERLRARFIVLPPSRRQSFATTALAALRSSGESIGAAGTVGSWLTKFEQSGAAKNAETFFVTPEFQTLDDVSDHAIRHLIHVVTLLASPDEHVAAPVQRKAPVTRSAPTVQTATPLPPKNLPLAPAPIETVESPAVAPKSAPVAAVPQVVTPSVAAVIARLHQDGSIGSPLAAEHLAPDDEQEIQSHVQRLESIDAGPNVHDTIGETIEKMMSDMNLQFPDENIRRRFVTVMTSRLKDIRSSAETADVLTRAQKVGGLGLSPELVSRIIAQAAVVASSFSDQSAVRAIAEKQKQEPHVQMPKPPKVPAAPQLEDLPRETSPAQAASPVPPPPPVPIEALRRPPVSQAPSAFRGAETAPPAPAGLRPAGDSRPTMSDIRGTSRLTGPVEELRQMSLADYHRLGPDPVSVIRRVYEKIQRLGKESFTRRAEGIQAWRESDVYRLYLQIGHESLASGKTIRDVALSRQQQGQPSLTEDEFMLVADLNRKLRF